MNWFHFLKSANKLPEKISWKLPEKVSWQTSHLYWGHCESITITCKWTKLAKIYVLIIPQLSISRVIENATNDQKISMLLFDRHLSQTSVTLQRWLHDFKPEPSPQAGFRLSLDSKSKNNVPQSREVFRIFLIIVKKS